MAVFLKKDDNCDNDWWWISWSGDGVDHGEDDDVVGDGVDDDVGNGVGDDDHNKEALTGRACYQCKSPAGWTHDVGMSALSNV